MSHKLAWCQLIIKSTPLLEECNLFLGCAQLWAHKNARFQQFPPQISFAKHTEVLNRSLLLT